MQLYWIPIALSCLALAVAGAPKLYQSRSVVLAVNGLCVSSFVLLLIFYSGVNTDWQTYRNYVHNCDAPGCTYFEPVYDIVTYLSAASFGFTTLKIFLIAAYLGCIFLMSRHSSSNLVILLAVASVSVAALPLMLGAIRQALTLPLLLAGAFLLERRRLVLASALFLLAGSLHYSALVAGVWYVLFWNTIARPGTTHDVKTALFRSAMLVAGTYLLIYALYTSSLGDTIVLLARIGETGAGSDFITTGGVARDLAITAERMPLSVAALVVLTTRAKLLSTTSKVSMLMYIAGSAFFAATSMFDRNIAGRTLATFRLADVLVLYFVVRELTTARLRPLAIPIAVVTAIIFVLSKSYMTMATVGFFDE